MNTNGSNSEGEDSNGREVMDILRENLNTVVIAGIYGILLIIVIIHVIVRWELRRRRLNSNVLHIPGDKSFKHKKLRQIISCDIERVRNISTDVRLINPLLSPSEFGTSEDDGEFPGHWFRMKAFDESADFVTSHVQYLKALNDGAPLLLSPSPNQLPLTKLLVLLDEAGGGRVFNADHSVIINEVTDLYNHCRYSQENFTVSHYQRLQGLLQQLHNIISSSSSILAVPVISVSSSSLSTHHTQATPLATPTTPHATPTTLWRERASVKDSLEPLISTGSGGGARETPHPSGLTPHTHSSSQSRRDSKGQRPANLELTPLVRYASATPTPSSLSPWTDTRVLKPETPV